MVVHPPSSDPAPDEDADYLTKAKYAFAIGKEAVAEQYVIAHLLANDAEAANILPEIRYCSGDPQASHGRQVRRGCGTEGTSTLTELQTDRPYPVRAAQWWRWRCHGRNNDGQRGRSTGRSERTEDLNRLHRPLGDELIKSFETAWDSGSFGTVFKDVETIVPLSRPTAGPVVAWPEAVYGHERHGMPMGFGGEMGAWPKQRSCSSRSSSAR